MIFQSALLIKVVIPPLCLILCCADFSCNSRSATSLLWYTLRSTPVTHTTPRRGACIKKVVVACVVAPQLGVVAPRQHLSPDGKAPRMHHHHAHAPLACHSPPHYQQTPFITLMEKRNIVHSVKAQRVKRIMAWAWPRRGKTSTEGKVGQGATPYAAIYEASRRLTSALIRT